MPWESGFSHQPGSTNRIEQVSSKWPHSVQKFIYTRLVARFAEKYMLYTSDAQKRYDSIKNMASVPLEAALPAEPEVDHIDEVCALLVKLADEHAPMFHAESWLLEQLGATSAR